MDASWLWNNTQLSDVCVRLICPAHELGDELAPPAKRVCAATPRITTQAAPAASSNQDGSGCLELAAHTTVLASVSGYWKARILRWTQGNENVTDSRFVSSVPSQQLTLEETVDSQDALQAAQHVLCYGYTKQFTAVLSVAMLMQMTVVADKWDMTEVVTACLQKAASSTHLSVEEVNTLLDSTLLEPVTRGEAYQTMQQACAEQLLDLLGTAQQVMSSPELLQSFCSLSLPAVKLWTEQDELQVDSENTVAVLFTHWWHKHSSSIETPSRLHAAKTLTEVLRASHLSRSFVLCALDQLPWFQASRRALQALRLSHGSDIEGDDIEGEMPYVWTAEAHADDQDHVRKVQWQVTRADLDQLHKDSAEHKAKLSSKPLYWCGYWWRSALELAGQKSELLYGVEYSSALPNQDDTTQYFLSANWDLTVDTGQRVIRKKCKGMFMEHGACHGSDALQVGESESARVHSYPPDSFWHSDGKLHLGAVMKTVS